MSAPHQGCKPQPLPPVSLGSAPFTVKRPLLLRSKETLGMAFLQSSFAGMKIASQRTSSGMVRIENPWVFSHWITCLATHLMEIPKSNGVSSCFPLKLPCFNGSSHFWTKPGPEYHILGYDMSIRTQFYPTHSHSISMTTNNTHRPLGLPGLRRTWEEKLQNIQRIRSVFCLRIQSFQAFRV